MIRSDRVCLLVLFVLAVIFGSVGPVAAPGHIAIDNTEANDTASRKEENDPAQDFSSGPARARAESDRNSESNQQ